MNYLNSVDSCVYLRKQINQIYFLFGRGEFVKLKNNIFQQVHACLNLAIKT